MRRALVIQHAETGPPGLLGEWMDARGIAYDVHRTDHGGPLPDPTRFAFVASLGSKRSPRDTDDPAVVAELELLARAVAAGVPVLGLCFGGQALAAVLGSRIEPAPRAELGWTTIETDHPEIVPAGPWLEWHYERFSTPPGATELARTEVGPQAFRHGRHLGVQFHPESTPAIVASWAASDRERIAALGHHDGPALIAADPEQEAAARAAAFTLFDGFLANADDPAAPVGAAREG
jgi:GMP synthase-like glutamine amidotransferase